MYDDLVRCLRYDADASNCCEEAADAIEELSKPRWIPVTERLPETEPGNASERVLVTDGEDVAIVEWFNFEECGPFWGYTGFGKDVTHWMPLPEPSFYAPTSKPIVTNYDRIIRKTPEELAEWLDAIAPHKKWALFLEGRTWLDWLKQEAAT